MSIGMLASPFRSGLLLVLLMTFLVVSDAAEPLLPPSGNIDDATWMAPFAAGELA